MSENSEKTQPTGEKKPFSITLYSEAAFLLAIAICSSSISLTTLSGWGTSLGVSLYYVLNQWIPQLSLGQWCWVVNVFLLALMMVIVGKVRLFYFFSLGTTVIFGFSLDFFQYLFTRFFTVHTFWDRILCYGAGFFILGWGIILFMRCNLPMMPFDLFVKEIVREKGLKLGAMKTCFDLSILLSSVAVGLLVFGRLVGLGVGTVILAIFTGYYIEKLNDFFNKFVVFHPLLFGKMQEPKAAPAPETPMDEI